MIAELRSDTFTKPGPAMMEAIMAAEVGDDVFGEDPTTQKLENHLARLFGKEAGLFCASGTMANQIAIHVYVKPGDEVICDKLSHVYLYEGGGIASNSMASVQLLDGDRGRLKASQIEQIIQPDNVHYPVSKLVTLENTVNKGGGAIYAEKDLEEIQDLCKKKTLSLHLDGARIFNALVETGQSSQQMGAYFDSVSICLSKGLGAPMGSVLVGSEHFIKMARRVRKRWGGGMRQSGFMAAAGLYAVQNNVERLKEDHHRARKLAGIFSGFSFVENHYPVETNIVILELKNGISAENMVEKLFQMGIRTAAFGKNKIRLVTHLDFTDQHLDFVENQIKRHL
jgi:threonine aldolase